ncbi:hypothetical protein [Nitratifractor sp.]
MEIKTASFEPRRIREANRNLRHSVEEPPLRKSHDLRLWKEKTGLLRRWWRWLFGG